MTDAAEREALPEILREALRRDPRPVRPLLQPSTRAALPATTVLCAMALLVLHAGLRSDAALLGPLLLIGPALVRAGAGAILILLALREAVPGAGLSAMARWTAVAGGVFLSFASSAPLSLGSAVAWSNLGGGACYPMEILLGLPSLLFLLWLVWRAYPLRPVSTALMGGLGVGLMADAAFHLICPARSLAHIAIVHGGAVTTMAVVGAAFGGLHRFRLEVS